MKKMLLVLAHPDDESYFCAGTVAKYVEEGWDIDLICATRGEAGSPGPYAGMNGEKLGLIRQKELEEAGKALGISSVTFLGYKDGALSSEQPGEIEDKLHEKLLELIPDCVITFDTTGISNNPDHIKMCFATTFSFQKYVLWIREQLQSHPDFSEEREPKLYYVCNPETAVKYLVEKKVLPTESFGKYRKGTPDKFVTAVIDIHDFAEIKKKALLAHVSQQDDIRRYLNLSTNPFLSHEYFIQRYHGIHETFMGKTDVVATEL